MRLTIALQSLLPPGQDGKDRWPLVEQRFRSLAATPDFVLLNECRGYQQDPALVARAEADLGGLTALPIAQSASGLATALLYNPRTVGNPVPPTPAAARIHQDTRRQTYHGWALAWWDVGLPQPLGVCSAKLTPYSADAARAEAAYIATHPQRGGGHSLIGLDLNFSPLHQDGPPPNWTTQYPYNIGSRATLTSACTGDPQPDRSVAQQIHAKGYNDAAHLHHKRSGDLGALAHTSGYDRIDLFYVSSTLADAVVGYQVLAEPEGASDHAGVVLRLDTSLIRDQKPGVVWT